eukprot:1356201-Lingulodinium_polyedra.AAC.1
MGAGPSLDGLAGARGAVEEAEIRLDVAVQARVNPGRLRLIVGPVLVVQAEVLRPACTAVAGRGGRGTGAGTAPGALASTRGARRRGPATAAARVSAPPLASMAGIRCTELGVPGDLLGELASTRPYALPVLV